MAESDWELGSGFAIDGMTGTVASVEFVHDNALGPNACAKFTFTDCVDAEGGEAEDQEQKFTVGKNYDNDRTGENLVGNGKINSNTNYGILIGSVLALFDSEDDAEARRQAAEAVPSTKESASWVGTRWTIGTITKSVMNPSTGKVNDEAKKIVFTEYHGRPDQGEAEPAKPAAKAAPAAKATSTKVGGAKPAAKAATNGVEQELWTMLVTLAGEHEDEDTFIDAALELDEVGASREAQKAIHKGLVWAAK